MGRKILIKTKIQEAFTSVLPVTIIMLVLSFTVTPMNNNMFVSFLIGNVLLIIGMGLFTLGADSSMTSIGERVGADIVKTRKLWFVILVAFILGVIVTISEPDLVVLADQVPSVPSFVLIGAVGIGVGIFLVLALIRIIFRIKLKWMLIISYIIVFALSFFIPKSFLSIAFDSGGVTTGPMTVPFILALGVGVSSIRSDDNRSDSFGLVALSSVGPIIAVMILGLIYTPDGNYDATLGASTASNTSETLWEFIKVLPAYMHEMGRSLLPIVIFFFIFQLFRFKMNRRNLLKIIIGLVFTYAGLVFFLTGVNVGFMPAGRFLGTTLAGMENNWICIPVAMLIGFYILKAEPAVHVMVKQVNELTLGAITENMMFTTLSLGMAVSVGLAMLRAITGISILWIVVPGYLIAIGLSFVVPDMFTAIAFDSGGVASGPMTATFLLPFAMGACEAAGGTTITDAFGVVALVAMTPLIAVQIMGLVYSWKARSAAEISAIDLTSVDAEETISFVL